MKPEIYRILAVDDNPKNLTVIPAILSSQNFLVDTAPSGTEALKLLGEKNYDVILLDIMMPVMDGFETCTRIKKDERNKDLPVIFLTAKTEIESITKAFQCGGFDYITKPFRSDELLARVKTHAELKRHREQQREINQWLEQKIEERTLQLRESNIKLSKANRELKSLDHAKNEFLRMINHEIRTPLNAIMGFTDILKSEYKSTKMYEMFQYIDIASVRLEKFLMVVLQITTLLANDQPIHKEKVQIDSMLNSVLAKFKSAVLSKKIKIITEGFGSNFQISGNIGLLHTCFESILDNSVKFSPTEGSIVIRIHSVEQNILIDFIDEGPGFSEEAMKRLFQFFAIGEKHIDESAGLGLALVKLIIDAHDAKIEILKNEPSGANVRLIFSSDQLFPTFAT
jgi:two-component system sensor histidine kinase/response regulator